MTDDEITANFAALREAYSQRKAHLAHRIACTLAAGDTVREYLGSHVANWTLSCGQVGLLPDRTSLPWMVEHLVARHLGFGTRLEFPSY